MASLLIVHHTPSPAMREIFEAVPAGATDPALEGVEVVRGAALEATASDVLSADGCVPGTPANIGYVSGGDAEKQHSPFTLVTAAPSAHSRPIPQNKRQHDRCPSRTRLLTGSRSRCTTSTAEEA
ncbi:hypothetical protein [Umezawaea sp.]|uniref:hypothetical protein n=1 Tax=Umezawaea sp. TaxID=1955258 RepID=UPI002ED50738